MDIERIKKLVKKIEGDVMRIIENEDCGLEDLGILIGLVGTQKEDEGKRTSMVVANRVSALDKAAIINGIIEVEPFVLIMLTALRSGFANASTMFINPDELAAEPECVSENLFDLELKRLVEENGEENGNDN